MKQNISTLMDGELCGDEAEVFLARIKSNPDARQEWLTYHLIGDALRQPDYMAGDLKADFLDQLYAEPTVLAPHGKHRSKAHLLAMSAVASMMAMAFLAWLSVRVDSEPYPQQRPEALRTVSFPLKADFSANGSMNDYLLAHHEFSPASEMRGAASYIRTVADRQPGAER